MNLIALGKEAPHVCLRYRIEPVRAALRSHGHWFSVQAMPRTPWGRLALYRELCHASVVIVQRRLLSTWEMPLLRRVSRHLIFDFDDALFQRTSNHSRRHSARRLARFKSMVQAADQVFAGNDFLAESASQFTSPSKVVLVPTCVDPSRYLLARHERKGDGVRLAWIGSSSTLKTLELQAPLWNALGKALPGLELHIICDRFPRWPDIKVVAHQWSANTEAHLLAQCDIGLAWMPDDSWSLGKCGLKVLQFQAAGLPVVTNPVGVHCHMVTPGKNGFWADTQDEWITSLTTLIDNPELRQQMGQLARAQVEARYSTTRLLELWKSALKIDSSPNHVSKDAA